jgi:effector-binding domain-containing protein
MLGRDYYMSKKIATSLAAPRPIAAVRRQIHVGEVSTAWRPALDLVWSFLRRHDGIRTDGHNIFVYHHPTRPGEPMEVDFGVEVVRDFEAEGEVRFTHTPGGQVASIVHVGSYDTLSRAHDAIHAWCTTNGRTIGPASWEIYGDSSEDPAKVEVEVVYLLR